MGYDLHITRRKNWVDSDNDIDAETWLAYAKRDIELHFQPENGPYFVQWQNPEPEDHSTTEWLDWCDGALYSKYPSIAFRKKIFTIAEQLDAVVQGDDGELYDRDGNAVATITDGKAPTPSQPLWRKVLARFQRISFHNPLGIPYCNEPLWFEEGDVVLDCWNNEQTIIKIDRKAFHGEGLIVTRDQHNNESTLTLLSYHALKPIAPK